MWRVACMGERRVQGFGVKPGEDVDWTDLADDWVRRWAVVNAVMDLRLP